MSNPYWLHLEATAPAHEWLLLLPRQVKITPSSGLLRARSHPCPPPRRIGSSPHSVPPTSPWHVHCLLSRPPHPQPLNPTSPHTHLEQRQVVHPCRHKGTHLLKHRQHCPTSGSTGTSGVDQQPGDSRARVAGMERLRCRLHALRRGNPPSGAVARCRSGRRLCGGRLDSIPVQVGHSGLTRCLQGAHSVAANPSVQQRIALACDIPSPAPNSAMSTSACAHLLLTLNHHLNTYLTSKITASPGSYTMLSNSWKPSVQRGLARQVDRS